MTKINLYKGDLPKGVKFGDSVAVDAEMMGLDMHRDRLCLIQLGDREGNVCLVQIIPGVDCPNLKALLANKNILKIFHYARMDLAFISHQLGIRVSSAYCTKIASRLCRTFTQNHGLKNVCHDLLGVTLSKEQQTSDWGADTLTKDQQKYAASDVLYLHALKDKLDVLLKREGRMELAQACFEFLPMRAELDILGFGGTPDIFDHH